GGAEHARRAVRREVRRAREEALAPLGVLGDLEQRARLAHDVGPSPRALRSAKSRSHAPAVVSPPAASRCGSFSAALLAAAIASVTLCPPVTACAIGPGSAARSCPIAAMMLVQIIAHLRAVHRDRARARQ